MRMIAVQRQVYSRTLLRALALGFKDIGIRYFPNFQNSIRTNRLANLEMYIPGWTEATVTFLSLYFLILNLPLRLDGPMLTRMVFSLTMFPLLSLLVLKMVKELPSFLVGFRPLLSSALPAKRFLLRLAFLTLIR